MVGFNALLLNKRRHLSTETFHYTLEQHRKAQASRRTTSNLNMVFMCTEHTTIVMTVHSDTVYKAQGPNILLLYVSQYETDETDIYGDADICNYLQLTGTILFTKGIIAPL